MKIGHRTLARHGFTIIETMMVLAVTGALLLSALTLLSGQQEKTQFSQAINDIQAQINDVITNVQTGVYNNTGNFTCSAPAGTPILQTGINNQGTNKGCIFIGRSIQFAPNGNREAYNVYDIVGLQKVTQGNTVRDTVSLPEAKPTAIAKPSAASPRPESTDQKKLIYGLRAEKMFYTLGGTKHAIGTVAFVTALNAGQSSDTQTAQKINVVPVEGTQLPETNFNAVTRINSMDDGLSQLDPDGGVTICFKSGGTDQYGVILIGGSGQAPTARLTIMSTSDATNPGGPCFG